MKTTNKVVENALSVWDNLMDIYLDRAAAEGRLGDTQEAAYWLDKANTLRMVLKRAGGTVSNIDVGFVKQDENTVMLDEFDGKLYLVSASGSKKIKEPVTRENYKEVARRNGWRCINAEVDNTGKEQKETTNMKSTNTIVQNALKAFNVNWRSIKASDLDKAWDDFMSGKTDKSTYERMLHAALADNIVEHTAGGPNGRKRIHRFKARNTTTAEEPMAKNGAFMEGEKVEIVKGPLAGKTGVVKKSNYNGVSHLIEVDGKEVSLMPSFVRKALNASYSVKEAVKDLDQAVYSANMAASGLNLNPEIASKIEKARKLLVEARNEANRL